MSCRHSARPGSMSRLSPLSPLSPLLPLLLSLARAAVPPPPAPRQLFQQIMQNASPVRPLQALQSVTAGRPLLALQNASPVLPLQALQSQLPVRPLQSLQGLPAVSWIQNSGFYTGLQNAAANAASSVPQRPPRAGSVEVLAAQGRRRRRRSVDTASEAEDLLGHEDADLLMAHAGEKLAGRQEKALQYLSHGYLAVGPPGSDAYLDLEEAGLTLAEDSDNELLSRAAPYRNRNQPDSPIYYIRLPPSPYVLVPGVGYVSSPNRRPLGPPPPPPPPPGPPPATGSSSFYNLPLAFMSNGKPTGVYQPSWSPAVQRPPVGSSPARPPAQPSAMFSLNKGPYVFNGRPTDIFILRDSYDTLYGDALSSFYP